MEQVSSGLVVYGPLGLWALVATLGVIHLFRENTRIHTDRAEEIATVHVKHAIKLEEIGRDRATETAALASALAAKLDEVIETHTQALRERDAALRERDDRIDRQHAELAQRILAVTTAVTDKLAAFTDRRSR